MAGPHSRIVFARSALNDLDEIVAYWAHREERERGEQYARDLPAEAIRLLGDRHTAEGGRYLKETAFPSAQEIVVFKRSYRIIYFRKSDNEQIVVLRFWHSHRDEPFERPIFAGL